MRHTRNAELVVVLGEDLAALLGLILAFIFVALAAATGNTLYDAIGSMVIGVVLVCVSVFVPLGVTLASALQIGHPVAIGVVLGIGASLAYMLPSGSSTNAIVAGSGWLRIEVMLRQGLLLVVLHTLVVTFFTYPLAKALLPAR